jgi:glycosyltransferase involved in cell wall biosynthesis
MRVLLANKFFRPGAGAETAFFATRDLLLQAGHEVVDFGMASADNAPTPYASYFAAERAYDGSGLLTKRVGDAVASIYSPSARKAIRRLVRDTRPDVAHLHNIYHQLTLSIVDELAAQGVPTVLTLHDYKIVCPSYTLFTEGARCRRCVDGHPFHVVPHRCIKGSMAASALGAVETAVARVRHSYERVNALISPSRFLADLAARRVPTERVHVLPNFLPVDELPEPLAAANRERIVLYAGRLEEVKGVKPLVAAFREHDTGGARLVVAGDGPLRAAVKAAARRVDTIEYVGRLTLAEVDGRLCRATALVVPSIWEENCPMITLQARVAGTPVIAARGGGLPELVTDGVDGLLCEPTDPAAIAAAVRRLAGDAAARAAMASAGQERFRRDHAPAEHLAGLERVYASARDRAGGVGAAV